LSVEVRNTGSCDGDEVVQVYLTDEEASTPRPIRQLVAFERVHLRRGEVKTLHFSLRSDQLALIGTDGQWTLEPGWFSLSVGGKQPGFSGMADAHTTSTVQGRFRLKG
jgi:beta-glucosidase